ncbi:hypothetical protein L798_11748 [Zootermopsis nevadensis]|uniref:Uncharacterized protein n=1 Tax=Zootermopsis nevadensis TaxID=136037 RepID=A0A067R574_ZOONE|nr:hypothetical protein L798_11748 [Zootermopsis nevadensis]
MKTRSMVKQDITYYQSNIWLYVCISLSVIFTSLVMEFGLILLFLLLHLHLSMADMRFFVGVDLSTVWRPGAYRQHSEHWLRRTFCFKCSRQGSTRNFSKKKMTVLAKEISCICVYANFVFVHRICP